jgi:Uncharacterized protein conserved in bacteria
VEEGLSLKKKYSMYSPLTLAYLGDSVFDLYIKEYIVAHHNMPVEKFHKRVSNIVCARNQAAFMDSNIDFFTEEELEVYNRGRNASVHTKAKNASMAEYKKATGFEAVIGYLHLVGEKERLETIIKKMLDAAGELL